MPVRTLFAGDDYLTRYPEGGPYAFCVDSPREKPGWSARQPGGLVEPPFAGTAVLFEERYYEVVRAEPEGARFAYYLAPWDESFLMRRMVAYDAAAVAEERRQREIAQKRQDDARWLFLLMPLVGLLPGPLQDRIEGDHGLSATRSTVVSAFLVGIPAAAAFVLALGLGFAGGYGAGAARLGAVPPVPLSAYLLAESLLRLASALAARQGMGSLPVVALFALVAAIRGRAVARTAPVRSPSASEEQRLAEHRRRAAWVETLKPLWGQLDGATQARLAERFDYDPEGNTPRVIVWTGLLAGAGAALALFYLMKGRGNAFDVVALAVAAALLVDSLRRWACWRAGAIEPSLLAPALRRLAAALTREP